MDGVLGVLTKLRLLKEDTTHPPLDGQTLVTQLSELGSVNEFTGTGAHQSVDGALDGEWEYGHQFSVAAVNPEVVDQSTAGGEEQAHQPSVLVPRCLSKVRLGLGVHGPGRPLARRGAGFRFLGGLGDHLGPLCCSPGVPPPGQSAQSPPSPTYQRSYSSRCGK